MDATRDKVNRIIVSAPDMFEALRSVERMLSINPAALTYGDLVTERERACNIARTAIAKVEAA